MKGPVAVLTVSDSGFQKVRRDESGPAVVKLLEGMGYEPELAEVVPDDRAQIAERLRALCDSGNYHAVFTTGGTGAALRDVTPEATRDVIDREMPGLPELMRVAGAKFTPLSYLSRAVAGMRGRVLIVNLPGSPKGAVQSVEAVAHLLPHIIDLLNGHTSHG
jgi:molybdenum cofactor synthesis domain-containing protein